ncbi:UNVERIFIED_CONTAM: hypothetical protein PYX00_003497 [Menopon gallinae]|uniref:Galactose-1-phosphate uridylyltransferase n=1 Tax=Menopon gallinae TaxID=328185 RepID=A0AAW2I1W7_9NEOP
MTAKTTPTPFSSSDHPHLRYNPLKGEWVLVSPNRLRRPWMGQIENIDEDYVPEFDPMNPLCPTVTRRNGETNPDYQSTFTFKNDYPALLEKTPAPEKNEHPLFQMKHAVGVCKVMCYHPKSTMTMAVLTVREILNIIDGWIKETEELGKKYVWVQIFENRGSIMGCSNPHPHCQIWASGFLPNEARLKDYHQLEYYKKYGKPMLLDYLELELQLKKRVVIENEDWVVVVPFWALWPFETMVIPKTHIKRFSDLGPEDPKRNSLAVIIKRLVTKYDNLFKCTFPYTMGWHGAPTGPRYKEESTHWVFHGVYYPPLLRSSTIKKFMVGYEMLAQGQRDFTAEYAAEKLKASPEIHFSSGTEV